MLRETGSSAPSPDPATAVDPLLATPLTERTVADVLRRHAAVRPGKVALIGDEGQSHTYQEVHRLAHRLASGVAGLGVGRQEPVLVMMDNHPEHVLTWVGLSVGAFVTVPVNTAYKGQILRHAIEISQARLAIVDETYEQRILAVADGTTLDRIVIRRDRGRPGSSPNTGLTFEQLFAGPATPIEPPAVWDINAILFTSGTEGPSKGVLCPHGHAFSMSGIPGPTTPEDVMLVTLPLFHAGGLWAGVLNGLRAGATVVLHRAFSAGRFWDEVRRFGCTETFLVGAMVDFLWRQPESVGDADHSLRKMVVVPAIPLLPDFAKRFGVSIHSAYGQTETGTIAVTGDNDGIPYNLGRPRPFVEMGLVDEHDRPVPPGGVGEIVVRTNEPWSVMVGYAGLPEETVRKTRNQWLHTGDAAYQDDSGQYIFVDRTKDVLRRRGENVSSVELEKLLTAHPDIAAAAVVGVPSDHSEHDIKAVIVLTPGATFDGPQVLHELADQLPYFMVPRYLEVVEELPMTPTMKVQKNQLRARGVTPDTWDCQAAGLLITRDGVRTLGRPDGGAGGRRTDE